MGKDVLAAYMGVITAFTLLVVQGIKTVWLDDRVPSGPKRDVIINALAFVINLSLLVMVLVTHNEFQPNDIIFYLIAATGQTATSGGAFVLVKRGVVSRQTKLQQTDVPGSVSSSVENMPVDSAQTAPSLPVVSSSTLPRSTNPLLVN